MYIRIPDHRLQAHKDLSGVTTATRAAFFVANLTRKKLKQPPNRTAYTILGMRYQEYPAPRELSPYVKLFWVFENRHNAPSPETLVTDGFPELIIHFGSPFAEVVSTGQLRQQPATVACGQLTRPLVLQSSTNVGLVGIRFQPSGMIPFLGTSMQALTNERIPAEQLFADIDSLEEAVLESSNDAQRIAACVRFLLRSIQLDRENTSVRSALNTIRDAHGSISVEELATHVGRSRRGLEAAFQRMVGTSPKMFCRITRFRYLVDTMTNQGPSSPWVQIALDSGYFDQSHLIRDFRQFAGTSPTAFLSAQTDFADSVNRAEA